MHIGWRDFRRIRAKALLPHELCRLLLPVDKQVVNLQVALGPQVIDRFLDVALRIPLHELVDFRRVHLVQCHEESLHVIVGGSGHGAPP